MLHYVTGDLLKANVDAIVNTVNLEGFMGKGLAYQFKKEFPENNNAYIEACKKKNIAIGNVFVFKEKDKIIINFPTKDKWREKSKFDYIEKGLTSLGEAIKKQNIKSIAIPPLGCGNGGLNWADVKVEIANFFKNFDYELDVFIYEPMVIKENIKVPKMSKSNLLLLFAVMNLNDKGNLRVQKMLFITGLIKGDEFFKFESYKHGPYSNALHNVLQKSKKYLQAKNLRYNSRKDILKAVKEIYQNIKSKNIEAFITSYKKPVEAATKFINGFKSTKNLEISATLIHIITLNKELSYDEVVNEFFKYPKQDVAIFSIDEVKKELDNLLKNNILSKDLLGNINFESLLVA